MNTAIRVAPWLLACAIAGCASAPSSAELDQQALAAIKASFRDQGIAKVDRLDQDLGQQACSGPDAPSPELAKRIEAQALATIRWPAGGRYLGDWREGEKLAQNGRGMTWTDASAATKDNGASCYNCHQIDKKEISFGTIGPSLWNYGKLRGVKDAADAASVADRSIHVGQAVEQQGLCGVLQHAALRPQGLARRRPAAPPDGVAARPEVAGQSVRPAGAARLR